MFMKMPIEYNKWRQKILLLNGNKLIVKSFIFPKITLQWDLRLKIKLMKLYKSPTRKVSKHKQLGKLNKKP